ncbi:divergent polysaccharide deacetylase family protein [Sulfurimonas sp.]|jgi:uncharacterized protein|uniref:divergent polysaccharide deacetylase family protein n=1 Tax=Sulfurimonas sp. TaxID=2022749 RepID=UPI0025D1641A|nr:divergent polysaccharide deacetylase family protein [Sulfurimonas sp.]MBT5933906.1 divergent polysaccharide deacetylase family protein [Sulfurimonas sp.]
MAKRKSSKKKSNSKVLVYIAWVLAFIAFILSTLVAGYYFGYKDAKTDVSKTIHSDKERRLELIKKLEKTVQKKPENMTKRLQEVLKKATKTDVSALHELDDVKLVQVKRKIKRKPKLSSKKPRLSIIIDDVGTRSQVAAIKNLKLPLTMSFLPPSKARPNTPKLAEKENFYMIHLPMEAKNFSAEEPNTLRVSDSQNTISCRIKEIKKLFPKVSYINNHTGSKFTSDEVAMNRLILALNDNKIHFLDSRTTAETKAPRVLKNFGLEYIARDVFLDHHMEKEYVLGQIKKAIKIAKTHGTAVAIGHPHKNTLQAIYESKKLFKDVELIYINKIF